jgi:peptidoglycan-N-acetylglucosamine deacetylase
MKYLYDPPLLVKWLFHESIWITRNNKVLLTFDDGPLNNNTDVILKALDKHKVKALFFCVGNNILKNPVLTETILSEGHSIGNHTMNHRVLSRADNKLMDAEILLLNRYMEDKHGYKLSYFRPPHGRYSFRLKSYLSNIKMTNIMWSLLTYDYSGRSSVVKSLKYMKAGSIVVFHDNIKSSNIIAESVEMLMERISEKKFSAGSPEECLR